MSFGGSMDEIQRLIMQVEGQTKVESLTNDLEIQQQAMRDLIAQHKAGQISLAQYTSAMQTAAASVVQTSAALKSAQGTLASLGPTLMQAGYIVDDFTAGLNNQGLAGAIANIQNNLPGFLLSLGTGAGLAGVLGIAGVAVAQLVWHWDDLAKLWGGGGTEAETRRQEALLKVVQAATKAVDDQIAALRTAETAGKPENIEAAQAAIAQGGGVDATVLATQNALMAQSPEVQKTRANADAVFKANQAAAQNAGSPLEQLKALVAIKKAERERDEATKRVEEEAKRLVASAAQGDVGAMGRLAELNPGGAFGGPTPAEVRADEAENERRVKRSEARRKAKEDADFEETKRREELRKQGVEARAKQIDADANARGKAAEQADKRAEQAAAKFDAPRLDPSRPQPTDQMEAASLEAEAAARAVDAQSEMMVGFNGPALQRVQAITQRLQQLYARNNQQMGSRGSDQFSNTPTAWPTF